MANITISDLRPAGADLFQDSESFLNELTHQEIGDVKGGILVLCTTTVVISGRRCRYDA
jgi:hypothetical protein